MKKLHILGPIVIFLVIIVIIVSSMILFKGLFQVKPVSDIKVPPEVTGEVLYIPFPVSITVDGDLSDWAVLPSIFVDRGPLPSSDPAENGSFTFSVAADKKNFYITMQMPDKTIITRQHGTEFWNEDSMEFYINATDDLNTRKYSNGIFQANINAGDIGNTDPDALTITGVFSSDATVHGFVFKTETGWGFEASVPLADLLEPVHGREIGFQAQINGASIQDRDIKLIWSKADASDQSWQYPLLFGRALFFELGRTDIPQPSEVLAMPSPTPEPENATIPTLISINQLGYFPTGSKVARFNDSSTRPLDWELVDEKGASLLTGKTNVFGEDQASGDHLHFIDFSSFTTPGNGYRILSNDLESPPFNISGSLYKDLKTDALAYFFRNRSGIPLEAKFAGEAWARPAGHLTDNAITCYQGKDANGKTIPGCSYTLNAAGGWYDAGDFGKYVVNGGITAWTLLNLYERSPQTFPDGSLSIPENANGVPDLLDEIRWEMEFLLSMVVPSGEPLAGMVHHKLHDESWAPVPMVPATEVDNDNANQKPGAGRYIFPPSTAATLNLAATSAVCARVWESIDPAFSSRCLAAAETAWLAARENPDLFAGNVPGQGGGNYEDAKVTDEFYWAASELFITTGKDEYQQYLLNSPLLGRVEPFDWGHTASLGTISLLTKKSSLSDENINQFNQNLLAFADELLVLLDGSGYPVLMQGDLPWGSNGQILNNLMLLGLVHEISGESKYLAGMQAGMDYLLGDNPNHISFVSGYGTYSMQHPHHRFWANDPANGFPPPPPGAVSGGPNANPSDPDALDPLVLNQAPLKRYIDKLGSFSTNEVAINWNAPLVWVTAFLDAISD